MLINFSNHPSSLWDENQLSVANKEFNAIVDLEFPQINPYATTDEINSLAAKYSSNIKNMLYKYEEHNAVHIMGEMSFCFAVIFYLQKINIECVCSTTVRKVEYDKEFKKSNFEFIQFRNYPILGVLQ